MIETETLPPCSGCGAEPIDEGDRFASHTYHEENCPVYESIREAVRKRTLVERIREAFQGK